MLSTIFILDKIGCIAGVIGAILVAKIKKNGYLWFMLCNLAFGILGYMQDNWGLVVVSIVMFVIDVWAYFKWKGEEIATGK